MLLCAHEAVEGIVAIVAVVSATCTQKGRRLNLTGLEPLLRRKLPEGLPAAVHKAAVQVHSAWAVLCRLLSF